MLAAGALALLLAAAPPAGAAPRGAPGPCRPSTWTFAVTGHGPRAHVIHEADGSRRVVRPPGETVAERFQATRDATGRLVRETLATAPGPDGRWGTPDDAVDLVTTFRYDAAGRIQAEVVEPPAGPSSLRRHGPFVAVHGWYEHRRDAAGRLVELRYRWAPGPDGRWHTEDDLTGHRVVLERAPDGRVLAAVGYAHPGPDDRWGTPDDAVGARTRYLHDTAGRWIGSRTTAGAGPDGRPGTPDDPPGMTLAVPAADDCTEIPERALVLTAPFAGPLWTPAIGEQGPYRPFPR